MPKGKHLWPAIWMMPQDSVYGTWAASGEIDIMEMRGQVTNSIAASIFYGGKSPDQASSTSGATNFTIDFSADWHLYILEWDSNSIRWYIDNQSWHNESLKRNFWSGRGINPYWKEGQPFDQAFYWVLNIGVGGGIFDVPPGVWGTLTVEEAKQWPKPTMEFDYLRVYEWK
jgi:beta-glucanase (GH16 family)